jgi:D-arabinose 1-dehydrogenase-like Zn-dependent alcohol dehydrogenase
VGGLGHLAVQFAVKMGFRTVAVARGQEKGRLARELGAQLYVDSTAENVGERLQELGGAKVILGTAASSDAMTAALGGLGINGKLIVLGASPDPVRVDPALLITGRRVVAGWPSGTSMDSHDTMEFSSLARVRPWTETLPLERAAEAYQRMIEDKARFRIVLTTGAAAT